MRLLEIFAKKDELCSVDASGLCTDHGGDELTFETFTTYFFGNIANVLFSIAGVVCVIMIVVCGFMLMTSAGDPGKVAKAKKGLVGAIIGLIVSLFAFVIVKVVSDVAGGEPLPN